MDYVVDKVRVVGATLHTETTGAGQALVLIPGGGGDAEMYAEVVPLLAAQFTVITFDRRQMDELYRIADTEGPLRGFVAFATMTMPHPPRLLQRRTGRALVAAALRLALTAGSAWQRVTRQAPGGMQRLIGNAGILFRRELPAFCYDYEPDLAALRSVHLPWWLAMGRDSTGRPYNRPAHVLGERLEAPRVEFPGGHTAYQQHPEEFARCLTELLNPRP